LSLGKKQYHANNFGLAEKYFRRAAELHPRDAEAWLGWPRPTIVCAVSISPTAPIARPSHRWTDGRDSK